ncbi:MAG: gliding motility-associated C-terminal domain-containing protein [Chitinophagales bacterium]
MKQHYELHLILALIALFSIASNLVTAQVLPQDSNALVNIYTTTGGANWINKTNWLSGNVTSWYGVSVRNNRVSSLTLSGNQLTGNFPGGAVALDSLRKLDLSDNALISIPDFHSLSVLDTLLVQNNKLTFSSLKPNVGAAAAFIYVPQDSVEIDVDTLVIEQSTFVMRTNVDTAAGINNLFQWYKEGAVVSGANARSYALLCFDSTMQGSYYCRIQNSAVSGLSLFRRAVMVRFQRLANAGADLAVCDSNAALSGNVSIAGSGVWSLVSGSGVIADSSLATSALSQLGVGANIFKWTIAGNALCAASSDLVTITRQLPPSFTNAGPDAEVCTTQYALQAATPAIGVGNWVVISGSGTVAQPSSPNSVVNGLSYGDNILRWQITNGVCPPAVFDEVKIFRADTLTGADAGLDISICPTDTAFAAALPLHTSGSWSLLSGSGNISESSNPASRITGLSQGDNWFVWTLANACGVNRTDSVKIQVYTFTTADAGVDRDVFYSPINPVKLAEGSAVAGGGNGTYTYQWSPAANLDDATAQHPKFSAPALGNYTFDVTVTDGHQCTATDQVNLTISKFEKLEVPTLITPNGDGLNDHLYAPGIESYPDNVMEIYDRFGELIFMQKGYVDEFAGIANQGMIQSGRRLETDTYFYVLRLSSDKVQKGYFELKR